MPSFQSLLQIDSMPLHLGPMDTPENFADLPGALPFELVLDNKIGILRQQASPALRDAMTRAYQQGNELGTPLIDDAFGSPYVEDFLDFLERNAIKARQRLRILEVGAGAGFISMSLKQKGHSVTSIEPGSAYRKYWDHYGLDVINAFFPTPDAPGPFDLIVSYAVLEHIEDSTGFLRAMADHLAPGGLLVAAVPNDSEEIVAGDPGMLIHEHYLYFTSGAFCRLLESAELEVLVREDANHSRVLFAVARPGRPAGLCPPDDYDRLFRHYGAKFVRFKANVASAIAETQRAGRSLGIYCPARAMAVLPHDLQARFFDDAPYLHGKYFPPFNIAIENKADLIARPVDEMWIMSRSFADVIANAISPATANTIVRKIQSFN